MVTAPVMFALVVVQLSTHPDALPKTAIKNWKPGPNVAAEISRLDKEALGFYRSFLAGRINQWTLIREQARRKIAKEKLVELSFNEGSDQVAELLVAAAGSAEHIAAFPHGFSHIPRQLTPGSIYPSVPGSNKQWQYIGESAENGIRFLVFRYRPHSDAP